MRRTSPQFGPEFRAYMAEQERKLPEAAYRQLCAMHNFPVGTKAGSRPVKLPSATRYVSTLIVLTERAGLLYAALPIRLVSEANRASRQHWRVRQERAKGQKEAVGLFLGAYSQWLAGAVPCAVHITRLGPRDLDDDNLQGAAKAVRDALAAMMGVDDRAGQGVEWNAVAQRRGEQGAYGVEIRVERRHPR